MRHVGELFKIVMVENAHSSAPLASQHTLLCVRAVGRNASRKVEKSN
jgi:hypothetical protein